MYCLRIFTSSRLDKLTHAFPFSNRFLYQFFPFPDRPLHFYHLFLAQTLSQLFPLWSHLCKRQSFRFLQHLVCASFIVFPYSIVIIFPWFSPHCTVFLFRDQSFSFLIIRDAVNGWWMKMCCVYMYMLLILLFGEL